MLLGRAIVERESKQEKERRGEGKEETMKIIVAMCFSTICRNKE